MSKRKEYKNFADLSSSEFEYRDFVRRSIVRDSRISIIAPHGGGIEPGTSEIAIAIADNTFSFYAFEGIKSRGNSMLHITSIYFDEPMCLQLVKDTDTVVAIHGCVGKAKSVYIGGLNENIMKRSLVSLTKSGFNVSMGSKEYPGEDLRNICNRGRSGQGMQVEITEGLRELMFKGLSRYERKTTTMVFWIFISAIREALLVRPE